MDDDKFRQCLWQIEQIRLDRVDTSSDAISAFSRLIGDFHHTYMTHLWPGVKIYKTRRLLNFSNLHVIF